MPFRFAFTTCRLSPLLGQSKESSFQSRLTISLVTPELAGNYTCRLVLDELFPNKCRKDEPRHLGCYAPESMATQRYIVDNNTLEANSAISLLLSQYPPTTWNRKTDAPAGLYLSRQSDAHTYFSSLGESLPEVVFECRLVVIAMPHGATPEVQWLFQRQKEYVPLCKASGYYTEVLPKMVPCKSKDLGVFRLTRLQEANMRCFVATLRPELTDSGTVGSYRLVELVEPAFYITCFVLKCVDLTCKIARFQNT